MRRRQALSDEAVRRIGEAPDYRQYLEEPGFSRWAVPQAIMADPRVAELMGDMESRHAQMLQVLEQVIMELAETYQWPVDIESTVERLAANLGWSSEAFADQLQDAMMY